MCLCYLTACYPTVDSNNTPNNTHGSNATSNPGTPTYTPQSPTGDSAGQITINSVILNPCATSNLIDSFTLIGNIPAYDTIKWSFSDGTKVKTTGLTVNHIYSTSGYSTIQAIIDSGKKVIDTIVKTIYIAPTGGAISASFTATPLVETGSGYKYYFSTNSTAYISKYLWNYGDGSIPQSTTNSSSFYLYPLSSSATNYTVALTVSNANGCTSSSRNYITVPASSSFQKLSDTITYSYTSPCSLTGESFTFSCLLNEPSNAFYQWNFGDNITSTGQTVSHSYSKSGIYIVTLNVSVNGKVILANAQQYVKAWGSGNIPTASFNFTSIDSLFTFQSTSTINNGTTLTNYWNFGDTVFAINNATITKHIYNKINGTKQRNVGLKVTSLAGCSDSTTLTITVPSK